MCSSTRVVRRRPRLRPTLGGLAFVGLASACAPSDPPLAGAAVPPATDADSSSEEDDDEGPLPKLDIFGTDEQSWLLHFRPNDDPTVPWEMVQIPTIQPVVREVCSVNGTETARRATSSTFTRDDRLLVSTGFELWEVMLPDCEGRFVTAYPEANTIINGITPDEGNGLYGVSATSGNLVRIDPDTGALEVVGSLGVPLGGAHGATWVDASQKILMVEGETDTLYEVDPMSGEGLTLTPISHDFEWVGFEYHPHTDTMYGCSFDRRVFRINSDGSVVYYAELDEPCNNLAAPWGEPELPPIG